MSGPVAAQAPYAFGYVRTLAAPALGAGLPRVVALADGSSAVFVGDSLAVVHLRPCGRADWARRYRFAGLTALPGLHHATALADGGLAFVTWAQAGAEKAPLVVRLDATGAVRWSRLVRAPGYDWYPYTLGETTTGVNRWRSKRTFAPKRDDSIGCPGHERTGIEAKIIIRNRLVP